MPNPAPNMTDYESSYRNDRLEVPEFFNFGFDVVDRWAEDRTKLALLSVDPTGEKATHHTFWDLKTLTNRFANSLRELGIRKGDRVFIMLPRIPRVVRRHGRPVQARRAAHARHDPADHRRH